MNQHFSIERLWWLLRADFAGGYRTLATVSATLAGLILIASALHTVEPGAVAQGIYVAWYGAALYVWGLIGSSRAFGELHDKARNEAYLLLPASAAEKTMARLLMLTVGLSVYLLILIAVVGLVVSGIHSLLLGRAHGLFNPLEPRLWSTVTNYLFAQSLYFLGAAWFKRSHFVKTTLTIVLGGIGIGLFALLTARILLVPEGTYDLGNLVALLAESNQGLLRLFELMWRTLAVTLPVLCWCMAWLRVREAQVSDGI